MRRYRERFESGTRHPGHLDNIVYPEFEAALARGGYGPLDIGGHLVRLDMTDFDAVDHDSLYLEIRRFIDA